MFTTPSLTSALTLDCSLVCPTNSQDKNPVFNGSKASLKDASINNSYPEVPRTLWDVNGEPVTVATNAGDIYWILGNSGNISSSAAIAAPESSEIESISMMLVQQELTSSDVMVWVTVPKVWTQGNAISIKYDIFNDGYTTASLYLNFYTYDPGTELHLNTFVNVRKASFKTVYLTGIIPTTTVGLKGAASTVAGSVSLQWDWGYQYVQIFGSSNFQYTPPSDNMASESSSSLYYLEGLPGDGWNINAMNALWHCADWNLRFTAATWADGCTTPFSCGRELTEWVTIAIIYTDYGDYHNYTLRDLRVLQDLKGVCDEKAVLTISLSRAMGIPARLILAQSSSMVHAWCELWDGYLWIHSDPTWLTDFGIAIWNNSYIYQQLFTYWTGVQIHARGDDNGYQGDGSNTDGKLACYHDFYYICGYDGLNQYCTTPPPYNVFCDPYG